MSIYNASPEADPCSGPLTVCLNQSGIKYLRINFFNLCLIILDLFLEWNFLCKSVSTGWIWKKTRNPLKITSFLSPQKNSVYFRAGKNRVPRVPQETQFFSEPKKTSPKNLRTHIYFQSPRNYCAKQHFRSLLLLPTKPHTEVGCDSTWAAG